MGLGDGHCVVVAQSAFDQLTQFFQPYAVVVFGLGTSFDEQNALWAGALVNGGVFFGPFQLSDSLHYQVCQVGVQAESTGQVQSDAWDLFADFFDNLVHF